MPTFAPYDEDEEEAEYGWNYVLLPLPTISSGSASPAGHSPSQLARRHLQAFQHLPGMLQYRRCVDFPDSASRLFVCFHPLLPYGLSFWRRCVAASSVYSVCFGRWFLDFTHRLGLHLSSVVCGAAAHWLLFLLPFPEFCRTAFHSSSIDAVYDNDWVQQAMKATRTSARQIVLVTLSLT